jgi:hypothetical protein
MYSRTSKFAVLVAAGSLLAAVPSFASTENQQGQGQAIVTVLPAKNAPAPTLTQQDLSAKVNNKATSVTALQPLSGMQSRVEMVVLIDGAARSSLGTQMGEIQHFVQTLPANTAVTIAYMQNGRAVLTGPLSTDRAEVLRGLHITGGGVPGVSASPYFCLSDLAKNWPSRDHEARREVVMITDGVDYYDMRYDADDPYVQSAINDSVRAQLMVYSIYWRNVGRVDRSFYQNNAGQNLLTEVTQATGGQNYWEGMGNPVSFQPYFEDIQQRLNHQYEVSFMAPSNGKPQLASFRLKLNDKGAKVDAPQEVLVVGSGMAGGEQ